MKGRLKYVVLINGGRYYLRAKKNGKRHKKRNNKRKTVYSKNHFTTFVVLGVLALEVIFSHLEITMPRRLLDHPLHFQDQQDLVQSSRAHQDFPGQSVNMDRGVIQFLQKLFFLVRQVFRHRRGGSRGSPRLE